MLSKSKKIILSVITALVIFGLTFLSSNSSEAKEPWGGIKFIRAADSSTGSLGFQLWTIYASYWDKIPGIRSNAFAAGTNMQIFLISEGKSETGQIGSSELGVFKDPKKVPIGKKPVTNVVSIWSQAVLCSAFFVRADSKIKTIEDLKGANIGGLLGIGSYGGGNRAIMEAIGLTPENAGQFGGRISNMSAGGARDALRDGSLDVWLWGGSPAGPSRAVFPLEETIGLRVIVPSMDVIKKASQLHPGLQITEVDWSRDIKSQKGQHFTLGDVLIAGVRDDFPGDLVYEMLKQIFETDALERARALGRGQQNKWIDNARIGSGNWKEHPAAVKYYEDHGVTIRKKWLYKAK